MKRRLVDSDVPHVIENLCDLRPSTFTGPYDVNQDLFLRKKRLYSLRNGGIVEAVNHK